MNAGSCWGGEWAATRGGAMGGASGDVEREAVDGG